MFRDKFVKIRLTNSPKGNKEKWLFQNMMICLILWSFLPKTHDIKNSGRLGFAG
jgi:hypothetical protein